MGQIHNRPVAAIDTAYNPQPTGKSKNSVPVTLGYHQFSVFEHTLPNKVASHSQNGLQPKSEPKTIADYSLKVVDPSPKALVSSHSTSDFWLDDFVISSDQARQEHGLQSQETSEELPYSNDEITMSDFEKENVSPTQTTESSSAISQEQAPVKTTQNSVTFQGDVNDGVSSDHSDDFADTLEALEELLDDKLTIKEFQSRLGEIYQDIDALKDGARELHQYDSDLYEAAYALFNQVAIKMVSYSLEHALVDSTISQCQTPDMFKAELENLIANQETLQKWVSEEFSESNRNTPVAIDATNWWGNQKPIQDLSSALTLQLSDILDSADDLFHDLKKSADRQ